MPHSIASFYLIQYRSCSSAGATSHLCASTPVQLCFPSGSQTSLCSQPIPLNPRIHPSCAFSFRWDRRPPLLSANPPERTCPHPTCPPPFFFSLTSDDPPEREHPHPTPHAPSFSIGIADPPSCSQTISSSNAHIHIPCTFVFHRDCGPPFAVRRSPRTHSVNFRCTTN